MSKRNVILHLAAWSTLLVLIIVAVDGEPAGYVQSRPVYKPAVPKLPKLLKIEDSTQDEKNPNRVTQTVYGFLDFVTTIGNTVMVFTPQTKKGLEIVPIQASSSTQEATAAEIKPTISPAKPKSFPSRKPKLILPSREESIELEEAPQEDSSVDEEEKKREQEIQREEEEENERQRQDEEAEEAAEKENNRNEEETSEEEKSHQPVLIESSEYEPQIVSTTSSTASTTTLDKLEHSSEVKSKFSPFVVTPKVQPFQKVSLVSVEAEEEKEESKEDGGDVEEEEDESKKTGLISKLYETRVKDGRTTVFETSVIGTLIGKNYARVFESTSTVLPQHIITATKAAYKDTFKGFVPAKAPSSLKKQIEQLAEKAIVKSETVKVQDEEEEEGGEDESEDEPSSPIAVEPTPTATEEQTLYILPEKEKKAAEIYVSPVPNANAYSRQPHLFVDISPAAKSFDFVTATPTSRKNNRKSSRNDYLSRFQQRNNRNQASSTESNELLEKKEASTEDYNGGRRANRFRSRNRPRNGKKVEESPLPTVSVFTSATPSRRFNKGGNSATRTRSFKFAKSESGSPVSAAPFKPRSFGSSQANKYIQPTSSTSIYRFKLNRPTGRWRYKPSPKPKVKIIKTEEELENKAAQQYSENDHQEYLQNYENGEIQGSETRTESNELLNHEEQEELLPETIRVATITPTEFSDLDKFLEIATIKSPYVFQAGNVKNTRYITQTKTFTKDNIQPTQASLIEEATIENILQTKAPYERILEGSSDVATLPVIALGGDVSTPPLETITQSFSTTQEAGSEHREELLSGDSDDENDQILQHILAPPDELTLVGSEFDLSVMEDKFPKSLGLKSLPEFKKPKEQKHKEEKKIENPLAAEFAGLTPEQIAFLRYFNNANNQQQQQQQQQKVIPGQQPNFFPQAQVPSLQSPLFEITSSPVVINTVSTVIESKTLRILFGAKPTHTVLYSTKVIPTKATSWVMASVPVKPTVAIPNFFNSAPFPLAYFG